MRSIGQKGQPLGSGIGREKGENNGMRIIFQVWGEGLLNAGCIELRV